MGGTKGGRVSHDSIYNFFMHTSTRNNSQDENKKVKKYTCVFCNKEMAQNSKRMRHHILNVCKNVTEYTRKECIEEQNTSNDKKQDSKRSAPSSSSFQKKKKKKKRSILEEEQQQQQQQHMQFYKSITLAFIKCNTKWSSEDIEEFQHAIDEQSVRLNELNNSDKKNDDHPAENDKTNNKNDDNDDSMISTKTMLERIEHLEMNVFGKDAEKYEGTNTTILERIEALERTLLDKKT